MELEAGIYVDGIKITSVEEWNNVVNELILYKTMWEELKDLHLKTKGELSKETINEFDIKIYGEINELEIKHGIKVI